MNSLSTGLKKRICKLESYVAIAAGAIIADILFIGPITGVANNGDYFRVMRLTGLQFITESRFTNLDRYFRYAGSTVPPDQSFITSHILPVEAAKLLNGIFRGGEIFDILFLGITYTVLFMTGIYLLVKGRKTGNRLNDLFFSILLLLIFCDVGYVSYFNSFLGEAAIDVYFLLMSGIVICMLAGRRITILRITCFFLSAVLFISAKQANALMGIFIAVFLLTVLFVDRRLKITVSILATSLELVGISAFLYVSAPKGMEEVTKHQTVFYGILKNSPTPEEDLEFLGLDKSLAVLKEVSFYDAGLPIASHGELLEKSFYNKISFFKVLKFYLFHPDRFLEKLEVTAKNSTMIRAPYLGNFLFDDTHERFGMSWEFSFWSTFKKTYLPNSLIFILTFFLGYFLVLLVEYFKAIKLNRDMYRVLKTYALLLLWVIGTTQFVIPILGDGEVDLEKHMFLYNLCFDMMLVSAALWIVYGCMKILRILKTRVQAESIPKRLKLSVLILVPLLSLYISYTLTGTTVAEAGNGTVISLVAGTGDYIKFGRYGGEDLLWRIVQPDERQVMLVAEQVVCFREFDTREASSQNGDRKEFGSNDWETSGLRAWLNSADDPEGFLSGFTRLEKSVILPTSHKSILSIYDLGKKEGGSNYYLWSNCVPLLKQNYDRAYFQTIQDRVFVPDVRELKELISDNGLKYRRFATRYAVNQSGNAQKEHRFTDYWLRTPYATRASFVRVVGSDGFVYYKDAAFTDMGVLPVLCLNPDCVVASGNGKLQNVFRLNLSGVDVR